MPGPLLSLQFGICYPSACTAKKMPVICQAPQLQFILPFFASPEHFILTPYQGPLSLSKWVPGHPVRTGISPLCTPRSRQAGEGGQLLPFSQIHFPSPRLSSTNREVYQSLLNF